MTHSADFTVIYLSPRPWARFLELATRAPGKHIKGGWQSRLRKWCGRMDEAARSLTLCHAPEGKERLDDMTFLERAIEQKNVGGWQSDALFIFAGSHPRFTGLTIRPRPERGRKHGATGSPAGLSAASRRRDLPADECLGLKVSMSQHDGTIRAVSALMTIYKQYGEDGLRDVLVFIMDTWGTDSAGFDAHLMRGSALFLMQPEVTKTDRLAKKIARKYTPGRLLIAAKASREAFGGSMPRAVAAIIQEIYAPGSIMAAAPGKVAAAA